MHSPPCILIVDDQPQNIEVLQDRLEGQGYEILSATTGEQALTIATDQQPDLILLDIIMPGMDGIEVCRRLKENVALPLIPVIMVTAKSETHDVIAGFEAGADEYLTKPLDQSALIARVKSMLRLKSFHDIAWKQANQLEAQAHALEHWNATLESQIRKQTRDLERMGRLKRFVSLSLAEQVVSSDVTEPFDIQEQDVTILSCKLQGFSTFSHTVKAGEAFHVLTQYHQCIRSFIPQFSAHLTQLEVDELRAVFNGFWPCTNPVVQAVDMAIAIHQNLTALTVEWQERGYPLSFGIGVDYGTASLGLLDLGDQWNYTIIGSPSRFASHLGKAAHSGRILTSESVRQVVSAYFQIDPAGDLLFEHHPISLPIFEVQPIPT